MWWGGWLQSGPHYFSVSPSPLGTNLGFDLGCTGLGLGLGGIGTKGLGPGLDNDNECYCGEYIIFSDFLINIEINSSV